jgi:hypothetical protein
MIASLGLRFGLFATVYSDLRHGSASKYGSTAIGLTIGSGLTYSEREMVRIASVDDNLGGDFLEFSQTSERSPMTEFLPGPALLMSQLWEITGVRNFAPYIVLQIVLESVLIGLFFGILCAYQPKIAALTAIFLVINVASIKRTTMVGYDFWPAFVVMVLVCGLLLFLEQPKQLVGLAATGLLVGIGAWFRSITVLLPYLASLSIIVATVKNERLSVRTAFYRTAAFLLPVILLTVGLSVYRLDGTSNVRPTRSTFWHTFFAGVGQFENPYGLINDDHEIWLFAQSINEELQEEDLMTMYRSPSSAYEATLRAAALQFVRDHPLRFVRNFVYRVAIMIAPPLYRGSDFVPNAVQALLYPIGFLMLPLWILGMVELKNRQPVLFYVVTPIFAYFFIFFGWFYVVGRVILPFLFLSVIVYLNGMRHVYRAVSTGKMRMSFQRLGGKRTR